MEISYFLIYVSFGMILYTWLIYPLIIFLFPKQINADYIAENHYISVIIAAHNEAKNLEKRIQNILSCKIPVNTRIEIIIASDGSTDNSLEILGALNIENVVFFENLNTRGRAGAHNESVKKAKGDILLFTDADTLFDVDFICKIVDSFKVPKVGLVSGALVFQNQNSTEITQSVGLYWRFEQWLRIRESDAGLFVFASGACVALRKSLYISIPPTGDVDFTSPLDIIIQGYLCLHLKDAIAYDSMPNTTQGEYKARVRMVTKNLHGTITRWGVKNIIKYPKYTWVILSHKVLRWFTPVLFIILFLSTSFCSILDNNSFIKIINILQLLFLFFAIIGWLFSRTKKEVRFFGQVYSFVFVNIAFLEGLINVVLGKIPATYKKSQ